MSNPFCTVASFAKTANTGSQQAMSDLGQMALMATGAGLAGRGVLGLINLAKRHLYPRSVSYPGAVMTTVPYPVEMPEKKEDDLETAVEGPPPSAVKIGAAENYQNNWWYYPAMTGVGMAGAYGGWSALDALLNRRRKTEKDEEVENSRKDFESALVEGYSKPRSITAKLASEKTAAEQLAEKLDQMYDQVQSRMDKQAFLGMSEDTWGPIAGSYLGLYALPTAAITGYMSYNTARKNRQSEIVQKAMAKRLRRNYMSRPSEVMAVPQPVDAKGVPTSADTLSDLARQEAAADATDLSTRD